MRLLETAYMSRVDYGEAWELQKQLVQEIDREERPDSLLLLEHPPTYTIGTDRHPEHLLYGPEELRRRGIQVFQIDRGGDITYHGPGQLVGYPLIYLAAEGLDLHAYLRSLEEAIISLLAEFGIVGGRKPEYTGVWVDDEKIAAIGVKFNRARTRKGFVTSHGFALNVKRNVEQEGFRGIIPCGITEYGVTSLEKLTGSDQSVEEIADRLLPHFVRVFGYEKTATQSEIRSRQAR
ncbi:lipoyl(octanoyl) transferase LipB [Cohnella lubricantis]|uniref:Octanoyltransferase n=1 Tax=Cohnella lubricantis TaxID=2163172 RepID=A0A841TCC0_9BACL|nr:lipoyl(octanoyl) transferase LipB [Cohnella lubricantis]MBB6677665.1 lipoyl(octanoyl) transferase LipB [Cohnella lubricantis]MBP2117626.1 lipoyl(octanoyl) transferase [Cohnella lubricantis]